MDDYSTSSSEHTSIDPAPSDVDDLLAHFKVDARRSITEVNPATTRQRLAKCLQANKLTTSWLLPPERIDFYSELLTETDAERAELRNLFLPSSQNNAQDEEDKGEGDDSGSNSSISGSSKARSSPAAASASLSTAARKEAPVPAVVFAAILDTVQAAPAPAPSIPAIPLQVLEEDEGTAFIGIDSGTCSNKEPRETPPAVAPATLAPELGEQRDQKTEASVGQEENSSDKHAGQRQGTDSTSLETSNSKGKGKGEDNAKRRTDEGKCEKDEEKRKNERAEREKAPKEPEKARKREEKVTSKEAKIDLFCDLATNTDAERTEFRNRIETSSHNHEEVDGGEAASDVKGSSYTGVSSKARSLPAAESASLPTATNKEPQESPVPVPVPAQPAAPAIPLQAPEEDKGTAIAINKEPKGTPLAVATVTRAPEKGEQRDQETETVASDGPVKQEKNNSSKRDGEQQGTDSAFLETGSRKDKGRDKAERKNDKEKYNKERSERRRERKEGKKAYKREEKETRKEAKRARKEQECMD